MMGSKDSYSEARDRLYHFFTHASAAELPKCVFADSDEERRKLLIDRYCSDDASTIRELYPDFSEEKGLQWCEWRLLQSEIEYWSADDDGLTEEQRRLVKDMMSFVPNIMCSDSEQ